MTGRTFDGYRRRRSEAGEDTGSLLVYILIVSNCVSSEKVLASIVLSARPVRTAQIDETGKPDLQAELVRLFDTLHPSLYRYLRWLGATPEAADDAIQEAFLRLHRHVQTAGAAENLKSWLYRVAGNLVRDEHKSAAFRRVEPIVETEWADVAANPEEEVLAKESTRRLAEAVRHLPEIQRKCLALRSEGLRYREIAKVLNIGTSTVADILARTVKELARELP